MPSKGFIFRKSQEASAASAQFCPKGGILRNIPKKGMDRRIKFLKLVTMTCVEGWQQCNTLP